jgi:hypothetical protein
MVVRVSSWIVVAAIQDGPPNSMQRASQWAQVSQSNIFSA